MHSPGILALGTICMQIWIVCIQSYAVWVNQYTKHFSEVYA